MFKVFLFKDQDEFLVFQSEKDVEAIQFALSLHQASNVPHYIDVVDSKGIYGVEDDTICHLVLK